MQLQNRQATQNNNRIYKLLKNNIKDNAEVQKIKYFEEKYEQTFYITRLERCTFALSPN